MMMNLQLRPHHFSSFVHEVSLITVACMSLFLNQAGITMTLSTMNIIFDSFAQEGHIDESKKVWFMSSFSLTVGTFILISGKIGDLFGLKRVFVFGWCWCTFWSLICGISVYSKSVIFFIICRAFQGIGFAFILPCGMGILGSLYTNGERKNLVFGIAGAAGPTGATIGYLMAGVVGQLTWWPWEFWLMAIACFLLGVAAYLAVPDLQPKAFTLKEKIARLNLGGLSTGIIGLILLNFIWIQGPVAGWASPYIIVLLILSIIFLVVFFYLDLKVVEFPLLPKSIYNRRIGLVLLCVGLGWGSFGIWQFYFVNINLNLRHYTPIEVGLTYIPILVGGIIASLVASVVVSRTKPSYIIMFCALCFTGGIVCLAVMPEQQSFFRISMGQMFILSWALDMSFPVASIILSNYLPLELQGMAGSLVSTVINYSISLFLGISSTVEVAVYHKTQDTFHSYRAGIYFGVGIAALGIIFAAAFIICQRKDDKGTFVKENDDGSEDEEFDKETVTINEIQPTSSSNIARA